MANRWLANGSSYITAPTLGNVLSSTIRVVCDTLLVSSDGYIVSQASATQGTREFGLFVASGDVTLVAGGTNTILGPIFDQTSPNILGSDPGAGLLDFEINMSTGAWTLDVNNLQVASGTATVGAGRVDGNLLRIGARSNDDTPGSTTGAFIVDNATRVGNVDIYIDGTLTRSYEFPETGSTVTDVENSQDGTLQAGTGGTADRGFTTDNIDNVTTGEGVGVNQITFSHTIGAGSNRRLLVFTGSESDSSATTISTVTYNGVSLTQAATVEAGAGSTRNRNELWELPSASLPAAGSYDIVVTWNAPASGTPERTATAYSFVNVSQAALVTSTATQDSSLTVTVNQSVTEDQLVISSMNFGAPYNTLYPTNYVARGNRQTNSSMSLAVATRIAPATGTENITWTSGLDPWRFPAIATSLTLVPAPVGGAEGANKLSIGISIGL